MSSECLIKISLSNFHNGDYKFAKVAIHYLELARKEHYELLWAVSLHENSIGIGKLVRFNIVLEVDWR